MNTDLGIESGWLTVNRECNFRCKWCYGEGTGYNHNDDMSIDLAKDLIALMDDIGVKHIALIGGEPTLWKSLFLIGDFMRERKIESTLVTNGSIFSSNFYAKKFRDSNISDVNVSLKAWDSESYNELVDIPAFYSVTKGLKNLGNAGIPYDVSITINSLVTGHVVDMVKVAVDNGAKSVSLSFCAAVFDNGIPSGNYMCDPVKVVEELVRDYNELDRLTKGNIAIEQSYSVCLWPDGFLKELERKNQVFHGCHLQKRNGIIFGTKGEVYPCNCLFDFELGKFGEDFTDYEGFVKFWNHHDVKSFYSKIIAYPSKLCFDCPEYDLCGGGCPLQWFVQEPKELIKRRLL